MTDEERNLLSLGLRFCPRPSTTTKALDTSVSGIRVGTGRLIRSVALFDFHERQHRDAHGQPDAAFAVTRTKTEGLDQLERLRATKSGFNPVYNAPQDLSGGLVECVTKFQRDVDLQARERRQRGWYDPDNLASQQRAAIRSLSLRRDIVVRGSDKNLGTAVMSRSWYHDEVMRQLSDETIYRALPAGTDADFIRDRTAKTLGRLLEGRAKPLAELTRGLKGFCLSPPGDKTEWVMARFYILPKLHKSPVAGRPIVASTAWVTTPISFVLSVVLRTAVQAIGGSWVLRDTKQFVRRIVDNSHVSSDACLLTADAGSCYTNMDIPEAVRIAKWGCRAAAALDDSLAWLLEVADSVGAALLFVLHNNYFTNAMDDTVYHQTRGAAMGTPCAPDLANLYFVYGEAPLLMEEEALVRIGDPRRSSLRGELRFYGRYLDDVFAICIGEAGASRLDGFLNKMHPTVNFTSEVSGGPEARAVFLDVEVRRGPPATDGSLWTVVHRKALNRFLYIPYQSYHPPGVTKGLVRGELIRFVRICSFEADFDRLKEGFLEALHARGYPLETIRKHAKTVSFGDRSKFLEDNPPTSTKVNAWVLPSDPLPRAMELHDLKERLQTELGQINPMLGELRIVTAWRRPPTLAQLLKLSWPSAN